MTLISKVLTQAISNSSPRRWGRKKKRKNMGSDQEDTQIIMMLSKTEARVERKTGRERVREWGEGEKEEFWGGAFVCCVWISIQMRGHVCYATLPRAVCPVSGGSGSPLSYQAKTRVSSAGARSLSLILLCCTLKESSSGAKQRQPTWQQRRIFSSFRTAPLSTSEDQPWS